MLIIGSLTIAAVLFALPAVSQDDEARLDVIEITGNLDASAVDFVIDRIQKAAEVGSNVAIIQLDSSATLTEDIDDLVALVGEPPLPVVVWVGPAPAVAFGGAAHLVAAADVAAAAPGIEIGHALPLIAGGDRDGSYRDPLEPRSAEVVESAIDGLIDITAPALSNLLVELDGMTVNGVELETLRTTDDDSTTAIRTVFSEPGLWTRTLRTAVSVEAAFFFLVIGLTVAVFEFYAIGPGVAAGVSVVCLLIAGYGLAVLPLVWWAVLLTFLALWLMTVDFQRGGAGPLTLYGTVLLFYAGINVTDAAPQITPSRWIVAVIVISIAAFYVFAMSTVARSRFSTPTIGREHLVGRTGTAITEFGPNGHVEVDGARWQAAAHREAGLSIGDEITVVGVDGLFLEVEPSDQSQSD